jgi:branched-chain amino acid transport system ATP-binding protein
MDRLMLNISGLHVHYGDSHVLRDVDLDLPAGHALGLLGRNGMGKTTLIRTLMGYLKPTQGRLQWDGRDVTGWVPERMARLGIGYVPEGRGIFSNLSVRENLVMASRPGAWTLDRVLATFPRLAERLSHGGQQLSGGEQQMLAIGRALMTQPKLLILDEATEGLAPLIVAEIWRVIGELRASGLSTLLVDRNYRAVLTHTDQAVVLEKGRVVMSGASQEIAAQPEALARVLGV